MTDLTIVTNNQPRNLLTWWDLTAKEQAEFDYLDTEDAQYDAEFVRYRGWVYDISQFMRCKIENWDGINTDTFFSATLCKFVNDNEQVIMGRCFS